VVFDHDAAFRASWAVDVVLSALDVMAEERQRRTTGIMCSCSGPYADSLKADVAAAGREAERCADQLRALRSRIGTAREDAFLAQARVEVQRAFAAETAAAAAAAAMVAPVATVGAGG
jgi:hypothetical protein